MGFLLALSERGWGSGSCSDPKRQLLTPFRCGPVIVRITSTKSTWRLWANAVGELTKMNCVQYRFFNGKTVLLKECASMLSTFFESIAKLK
jgi:hypothetical protein